MYIRLLVASAGNYSWNYRDETVVKFRSADVRNVIRHISFVAVQVI
jgi:hypothetical protein